MTTPLSVVPGKPEAELAAEIKEKIGELLKPVCAAMDEARAAGLMVVWEGLGPTPPDFKTRVTGLRLVKHF